MGGQVSCKGGDKQVMVQFTWRPWLHRQGLAQIKRNTSQPEKLMEKDPCCKACPAPCAGHGEKEWEALLGYRDAALGCAGRVRDVLGAGNLDSGSSAHFGSTSHWKAYT